MATPSKPTSSEAPAKPSKSKPSDPPGKRAADEMLATFFYNRESAIRHCDEIRAALEAPFPTPSRDLTQCGYNKDTLAYFEPEMKAKIGHQIIVANRAINVNADFFDETELRACLFRGVIAGFSGDGDPYYDAVDGVAPEHGIAFDLADLQLYTSTGWVGVPDMRFTVEEDTRVLYNVPIVCE